MDSGKIGDNNGIPPTRNENKPPFRPPVEEIEENTIYKNNDYSSIPFTDFSTLFHAFINAPMPVLRNPEQSYPLLMEAF